MAAFRTYASGEPADRPTIVVAATFTAEPLEDAVGFWGAELNLPIDVRFAAYNQVFQQLLDPGSLMSLNTSGLNVIAVRLEDWGLRSQGPERSDDLESKVEDFVEAVTSAVARLQAPLLVVVCPSSSASQNEEHEQQVFCAESTFARRLAALSGVHVLGPNDLITRYQVENYDNPGAAAHGHVPYTPAFFASLGTEIVRKLRAAEAPPLKVLALDCDQTLWSGIVGEDGPLGVVIDASRRALQEFALAQRDEGVLLCLCSKNAEDDVLAVLERHPDMVLRREHFAAWRVNWHAKSENLQSLARELNVGADALVFLDDNPIECAEVRARCPEIVTLTLPGVPAEIPRFLANVWAFDRLGRTEEDSKRAIFYKQGSAREALLGSSATFADFISGLGLQVQLFAPSPEHLPRVAQLTQRTNQFNNTTIRRTEAEVKRMLSSGAFECLAVEASDRFGDYGLVGVVFSEARGDALWIDTVLMSCRALGRGVEHRVLARLGEIALARDLTRIRIPFARTAKNQPLRQFLEEVGARAADPSSESSVFELDAGTAAGVIFDPARMDGARAATDDRDLTPSSAERPSAFRLNSNRFSTIATSSHTAEQILAHMAASTQRRRPDTPTAYVAPRTVIEETLAALWAEALRLDRVGVFDDFFSLGGSSLQATVLVNRLQEVLDRSFESIVVFEAPTVAGFAELLQRRSANLRRVSLRSGLPCAERRGSLSSAQQRLWFLDQFNPGSTVYNERRAIRLRGALQLDALEGALDDVVSRHESLRTVFPVTDGRAEQSVAASWGESLTIRDLSNLMAAERKSEAARLIAAEVARPFDLAAGPLFRAGLLRLDADDHVLWLVFHHIIADGWSIGILLREIGVFYRARIGLGGSLPELVIQYLDFTSWQDQRQQDDELEEQRAYWRKRLANPPILEMPADHARPSILEYNGSSVPIFIPAELVERLHITGQRQQATLFMTLMAAFHVLLARHSGQDDIVVGFPSANRIQLEVEGLIGFFVNTLALRVDLSGNPSFDDVLQQVRERAIEAYAHQDVPFEQLVEDMVPQRDLARTPIFQAMLALFDDPLEHVDLPGVAVSPLDVPTSTTRFELVLNLEENKAGLRGALEFSTDLFDPETASRMVGHLLTLLEAIASDSSTNVRELPLLTEFEQIEILDNWAGGAASFDVSATLHRRFEAQVARTSDAEAVVFEGAVLSYGELNARANQLAHRLQRLGVGPDVLVGLCTDRSVDLVVGILGILKAGGAYVPLDPAYPPDRLGFLLEDSGVEVIVAQEQQLRALTPHEAEVVRIDTDASDIARESTENPESRAGPEHLAYIIYTSGSTGKPKGVPISHANVARLFEATDAWYGFGSEDVWTLYHSFAFDFSVWEIWGALLHGGRLVIVPYWVSRSPQAFHDLLREEKVTVLNQTPTAFRQLIQADQASGAHPSEMTLRYVIFGGEALDLQSLRPWFERYGKSGPLLVNMYGITETTVHVTYRPISSEDVESAVGSVVGRPIPDLRVYLLNSAQQPVPIGVPGEICVGGAGVARGYLNRPALTAERFVPNPFRGEAGEKLYRSGDLGRWLPNGDLEYLGRIDHQVKIRGFRIELGEIESAISLHPLVRETVVVAREDSSGDKRLVAYVVADVNRTKIADELKPVLRSKLPEYMVPAHFVLLASLPLTPNGKVDRNALPAPEISRGELSKPYAPARTPTEETMVRIWSAVLGIEQVSIDDNFFELGGDSILSIQVIAKCRAAGLHVTPRDLFRAPTIAALGEGIAPASLLETTDDGVPVGPVPLTPIQHWFFEQEIEISDHWNQAFVFQVPPDIDVDRLEEALHEVVLHHDALRLRYRQSGSEWRQEYGLAPTSTPIVRVDISVLPERDRAPALTARASTIQARLSKTEGPLLRAMHFDYGNGEPGRLLLVIHHLAVDGVSWRILIEDLESAYVSLRNGKTVELPPRTSSYKRWSEELAAYAKAEACVRSLDQWRTLSDSHACSLPRDHAGGENLEGTAREVCVSLDAVDTQALLQRVPAVYRTQINDALLTALGQALARWTSRESFLVELEGHGREDLFEGVDLSRTVGWFTTIFPFRLEVAALDPGEALVATKEQLRQVPDRGLSYGLLRYLGNQECRKVLSAQPQPELIFNYLGQFDHVVAGSSLFRFAPESPGPWHSPCARRRHALEVMTLVRDGRLEARFIFSEALHRAETIEHLANAFVDSLRCLISRCSASESPHFTPSDFAMARVDEAELGRLVRAHPGLEDLYPLSPMQRLFYSMHEPSSTVGLEEWRFEIRGPLHSGHFRRAWELLLERHTILRTAFTTAASPEPLQLVEQTVDLPWREEDLRGQAHEEQEARVQALAEQERSRGFELAEAPLLRLILVRRGDDRYDLLWLTHHLYIDGWSWPVAFKEIAASYAALLADAKPSLPEACSYGRYIHWLSERTENSEGFWKAELAGLSDSTPLDLGLSDLGNEGPGEEAYVLSSDQTGILQSFARRHQVTMSSVVQAAWALLLSHYSDRADVVFGAAFSGRPPELHGIDELIGPCVTNVPVRARISYAEPVISLVTQLQQRQPDLSLHQYAPIAQIQDWSGIPLRYRLFDSLVVFQNYVVDASAYQLDAARIRLVSGPDATNYPITLVVIPGPTLRLRLLWQRSRFSRSQGTTMLRDLWTVLDAMAMAGPDSTAGNVLTCLPLETRGRAATTAAQRQSRPSAEYVRPLGQMEETVGSIWCELFQVDQIGMDDNFFDLGGHSLLLIRAHKRLREEVRADLPIVALFQNPTARSLAKYLSGPSGGDGGVATRATKERAQKQKEALARLKAIKGKR
jgi:amino acid adenylation domain-containing protein/FkbH-like protein/non-ribosomal peptide synthase protein (TIGR01720 family)